VDRQHPKTYLQKKLEGSHVLQRLLLGLVLVGTSMVIGDGILTPAISGVPIDFQSLYLYSSLSFTTVVFLCIFFFHLMIVALGDL
jgi:K+ transporter